METIVALVDYDNQRIGRFRGGAGRGRGPSYRDHSDFIDLLVEGLLDHRARWTDRLIELRVRFYGGWTIDLEGTRTDAGDMVTRAITERGKQQRFRNTRLFLELAEAPLAAEDVRLYYTSRQSRWLGTKLYVGSTDVACIQRPYPCHAVRAALSWAKNRCPTEACRVKTEDVFVVQQQKLVDTLLVCDAIMSVVLGYSRVIAVSMDDDIVPGLLSAAGIPGCAELVRFGKREPGTYDRLLEARGIEVTDYPTLR